MNNHQQEFRKIHEKYINNEITPLEATIKHWELVVSSGVFKSRLIPSDCSITSSCFFCDSYTNCNPNEEYLLNLRACKGCPIAIKEGIDHACQESDSVPYRNYWLTTDLEERKLSAVEFVKYLKELRSKNGN